MVRKFSKLSILFLFLLTFKITIFLCQTIQVKQQQKNEAIKSDLNNKKLTFIRFPQTVSSWNDDSDGNKSVLTIYYRIAPETMIMSKHIDSKEEPKMKRNYSNDVKHDFKWANSNGENSQSNVIQLIIAIMATIIVLCILINYYYNKLKNGHYNLLKWNKAGCKGDIIYTI